MMDFVRKLADRVIGVLSGFDRLLFRGMLRSVVDARGLNGYLYGAGVPMANFKEHAQEVTHRLQEESLRHAREIGCEIRYLESSQERKKDLAQEIAQRDGIRDGLICVLRCVELCLTFPGMRSTACGGPVPPANGQRPVTARLPTASRSRQRRWPNWARFPRLIRRFCRRASARCQTM